MAILLAGYPDDLPTPPPENATPLQRARWCETFAAYCWRRAEMARELRMPPQKWQRAGDLASFAGSVWREHSLVRTLVP